MSREVRVVVIVAVMALLGAGWWVARQSEKVAPRAVIVRRPDGGQLIQRAVRLAHGGQPNVAPLATVTVSSNQEQNPGGGVADGVVDGREWLSGGEGAGAWIRLEWERPPMINEIELYDRPNPQENVLRGVLSFDDGSVIQVPALPPGGEAWSATFPAKRVRWVMFRIDSSQGANAGLAEIMVYGMPVP